jgi:hypothetical protein
MVYSEVNSLTNPNMLILNNMEFYNWIYDFYSFIGLGLYGGNIQISGSVFERFASCGAIVSNNYPVYNVEAEALRCGEECEDYNGSLEEWMEYYEGDLKNYHKANAQLNPLFAYGADASAGLFSCVYDSLTTPCFDLLIQTSSFKEMNFITERVSDVLFTGSDGLQQRASVLALKDFRGIVRLEENTFSDNKINMDSCFEEENFENLEPIYDYLGTREFPQINSLISITDHRHDIVFIKNTFNNNMGAKGPIYIERTQDVGI